MKLWIDYKNEPSAAYDDSPENIWQEMAASWTLKWKHHHYHRTMLIKNMQNLFTFYFLKVYFYNWIYEGVY